jgi:hypothetical protein
MSASAGPDLRQWFTARDGPGLNHDLPAILGLVVPTNRVALAMALRDQALVLRLRQRPPEVRMTEDIDIAVAPDAQNARRWGRALSRLPHGGARELEGEADPFTGDHLHAIRINGEYTVDVMPAVAGVPWAEPQQHIEWLQLEGELIPVLDLRGLLKTKQGLRPKDQQDAAIIREALARLPGGLDEGRLGPHRPGGAWPAIAVPPRRRAAPPPLPSGQSRS